MTRNFSYLKTARAQNGAAFLSVPFEHLKSILPGPSVPKANLPALYCYNGIKGTYSDTDLFFIDIDTVEGVDKVIENKDYIFAAAHDILFIQKSYSGKLHIVGTFNEPVAIDNWVYQCKIHTCYILKVIEHITGVDYFSIPKAVDKSTMKFSQALYLSANEIYTNTFNGYIDIKQYEAEIVKAYPKLFDSNKVKMNNYTEKTYNYTESDSNVRLCVDRNFEAAGYSGNDLRWRITSTLFHMFGKDHERVFKFINKHFSNACDFGSKVYDKGINSAVKGWLEETFSLKEEKADYREDISKYIYKTYTIDDKISMHPEIVNDIKDTKKVVVVSECGSGKTYLITNELADYTILVPWESIKNGAYEEDFQQNVHNFARLKDESFKEETIIAGKVVVDEVQMLTSESDYRKEELEGVWETIKNCGEAKLFTGTLTVALAKELTSLGFKVIRIKSYRKPIGLYCYKVEPKNIDSYLYKFFATIRENETRIFCSNKCLSRALEMNVQYISRQTFNNSDAIKRLLSKNGRFEGPYCATKYIVAGVDNQLNTETVYLCVRNSEFSWVEMEQLSNRFRKARKVIVIVLDDADYNPANQQNFKNDLQKVFNEERIEFHNRQLRDACSKTLNFAGIASKSETAIVNKGVKNYIIENKAARLEYDDKEGLDFVEEMFELNFDDSNILKTNNLHIIKVINKSKELTNNDAEQNFYLDNSSFTDNNIKYTKDMTKFDDLNTFINSIFNEVLDYDLEQIDISKSRAAYLKDANNTPKICGWLLEHLKGTRSDELKAIFIQKVKGFLYDSKKGWADAKIIYDQLPDPKNATDKEIFHAIYETYKDKRVTCHDWNEWRDYTFLNGKTVKLPYYNPKLKGARVGKAVKYKYALKGNHEVKFKTQKECYDWAVANLGYNGKESGWKMQIKQFFERI